MSEEISVAPNESTMVEPSSEPLETVAAPEVVAPEPQLFDLPDGRKVDAETLSKEWKENFLPEFTKKSQTLAQIERAKENNNQPTIEDPYEKPDYIPKNYAEVIREAERRALETFESKQQAEIARVQAVEDEVAAQLDELKKGDANLNENALFLHANEYRTKYGVSFPDLKSAYTHMKDVAELTKNVQQATVKNIARRSDPVSTTQGKATGSLPSPNAFTSARDYLKAVQGLVK